MEYKKVEAVLEIETVKDMITNGDYAEARDKLHEVKKFFPDLDNFLEISSVCDILCSSGFDFLSCGTDWYWVLQVKPDADQSIIYYQYNKYITLLEPIRDFPGAQLALETVENAFLVLSDQEKRLEFDMKRDGSLKDYGSSIVNSVASKPCDGDFYNFDKIRKAEGFSVGQVWAAYDKEDMPRKYAWISSIDRSPFTMCVNWLEPDPMMECQRSWCEARLPVVCGFFQIDKTHQTIVTSPAAFSHVFSGYASPTERIQIYPKKHEIWAIYKDWKPYEWILDPEAKKTCKLQIVEIVKGYSGQEDMVVDWLVKLKGFKTVFKRFTNNGNEQTFTVPAKCLYVFSHNIPAYRFVGGERNDIYEGLIELDPSAVPDLLDYMPEESSDMILKNIPPRRPLEVSYPEAKQQVICKWSAEDFNWGQVWAVQTGFDSMPRQYVVVEYPASDSEVRVSLLDPYPMSDDHIYWIEQKLPTVCGLFIPKRTAVNMKMSQFSYLASGEFIPKGSFFKIYPKKGEIWAMYKNWDRRWKKSDFSSYKCRIVEIITDFCKESGLMVAGLEEVPGCATFFRRQLAQGYEITHVIRQSEMLSLSHKIPAFTVPGIGVHSIPEGSWHLEADSLPPNQCK